MRFPERFSAEKSITNSIKETLSSATFAQHFIQFVMSSSMRKYIPSFHQIEREKNEDCYVYCWEFDESSELSATDMHLVPEVRSCDRSGRKENRGGKQDKHILRASAYYDGLLTRENFDASKPEGKKSVSQCQQIIHLARISREFMHWIRFDITGACSISSSCYLQMESPMRPFFRAGKKRKETCRDRFLLAVYFFSWRFFRARKIVWERREWK